MLLLTRLQSSKTDKFTTGFVRLVGFTCAIQKEGIGTDWLISGFEAVQPG